MKTSSAVALIICAALILSSLPYAFGYFISSPQRQFTGLTYNIDDACVYLSWMRQTADGHLLIRNQFAVEPQKDLQFNILFLVLGWMARILNLPLVAVYHIARLLLGAALLWMIYCFGRRFLSDDKQRLALLLLIAFSSGIGWMFGTGTDRRLPVDLWQPEAITLLSIYLNPLFLCAQVLMLASLIFLLRCRETRKIKYALWAGLMLLLLANIHTYDIVTVAAVWAAFLAVEWAAQKRMDIRTLSSSVLAAVIAAPALLYQWHLYHSEEVFRLRVGTPAPSPPLSAYMAGYAIVLALAVLGAVVAVRRKGTALLPLTWAVIGFLLPYAPFSQQRKLVMGLHIPLAILAVYALAWLAKRWQRAVVPLAVLAAILALPSNLLFLWRDTNWLLHDQTATRIHRPFLGNHEISALQWLRANSRDTDSILAFPDIGCFVPALTGARTYVGHWSETPRFGSKLREWREFVMASEPDEQRQAFLRRSRTTFVWWDSSLKDLPSLEPGAAPEPVFSPDAAPYLRKVFSAGKISIYRVKPTSS